jgi:hypothetical protein
MYETNFKPSDVPVITKDMLLSGEVQTKMWMGVFVFIAIVVVMFLIIRKVLK